jgi:hypothetical protein
VSQNYELNPKVGLLDPGPEGEFFFDETGPEGELRKLGEWG